MTKDAPRFPSVVAAKKAAVAQLSYYRSMMGTSSQQTAISGTVPVSPGKGNTGSKPAKK